MDMKDNNKISLEDIFDKEALEGMKGTIMLEVFEKYDKGELSKTRAVYMAELYTWNNRPLTPKEKDALFPELNGNSNG